ncbi:MAG TPA: carbohydrate ABC transporter permease [Actinoplanes sp.]|jgi:multiple sugar transport system permease protein
MTTTAAVPRAEVRRRGNRTAAGEAHRLLPRPLLVTVTVILCAMVVIPTSYIVLASLNTDIGVAEGQFWPSTFSVDSYTKIWTTANLATGLFNSILVCAFVAVFSALLGTITAYVLVRFTFTGRLTILRGLVGLQSIPGTLMLLPVFVLFSSAGNYLGVAVVGSRWGLFIAYLTFALPFSTWVMVTYLRGLPRELEEAGRMDGAGTVTILFRIIVPLSLPAIVVSAIFAFLLGWNDVLFASVLTRPETQTAAVALSIFATTQEGGALPVYSQVMAAALVTAAPVVLLYLVFQRYLVGGLTAGGVK